MLTLLLNYSFPFIFQYYIFSLFFFSFSFFPLFDKNKTTSSPYEPTDVPFSFKNGSLNSHANFLRKIDHFLQYWLERWTPVKFTCKVWSYYELIFLYLYMLSSYWPSLLTSVYLFFLLDYPQKSANLPTKEKNCLVEQLCEVLYLLISLLLVLVLTR